MPPTPAARHPLTPHQAQFVRNMARTGDFAKAAEEMGIAYSTAKGHLAHARQRANVPPETDVVTYLREKWPAVFTGIKQFAPQPSPLSRRQQQVLRLIAKGESLVNAAMKMGITYNSAKTHLAKAFKAVGATTKANAIAIVYAKWPHVFNGIEAPTPRRPPTRFQCKLLARYASGQRPFAAGRALGFNDDSTRSELRSIRRTMNVATTEQAVYSAHVHGYIKPRSVIR